MTNVVKLKRGSGSDPSASDMVVGEPVIRTDTAELFFKKDDGTVAKVSGGGGGPDFKYLALRNSANNGAASYPAADFTLVTDGTTTAVTPAAAASLLVSYAGVIQQPSTGTSTPANGFALSGSTIKFSANIAAAPDFIVYQESGGIGEPSDNTVSEAKLNVSNSPTNGYFLSAQSGNTGGLTWAEVSTTDSTKMPLAGGTFTGSVDFQGEINFTGNGHKYVDVATLNGGHSFSIRHQDGSSYETGLTLDANGSAKLFYNNVETFKTRENGIQVLGPEGGDAWIRLDADEGDDNDDLWRMLNSGSNYYLQNYAAGSWETNLLAAPNGATKLYFDNSLKLETTSTGVLVTGYLHSQTSSTTDSVLRLTDVGVANYDFTFPDTSTIKLGANTSSTKQLELRNTGSGHFDLLLADNGKIKVGDSNDIQIYHDGTNSFITNATNALTISNATADADLYIKADDIRLWNAAGNEEYIKCNRNTAVELFYDNSKKFETTADGVNIGGDSGITGDWNLEVYNGSGNAYAVIAGTQGSWLKLQDTGSSEVLNIRAGGGHSIIQDAGTGNLMLWSDRLVIAKSDNSENMLVCDDDAGVELYYDNSKKLETTSTGVTISGSDTTGTIVKGAFALRDVSSGSNRIEWIPSSPYGLRWGDNYKALFGSGNDLQIYHDGSHSFIHQDGTGNLAFLSDNYYLNNEANTENIITAVANGAVSLYFDDSKKLETVSGGVKFNDHTYMIDNKVAHFGTDNDAYMYHSGTHFYIRNNTGWLISKSNNHQWTDLNGDIQGQFELNAGVKLMYDGVKKFETTSIGATVTGSLNVTDDFTLSGANANLTWDKSADTLEFMDNGKAAFGNGDDLKIYHDGNNSFIKSSGTGSLNIYGDEVNILNAAASEYKAKFITNGAVELYYDNTKQLSTHANGPYTESGVAFRVGSSGPVAAELFTVQRNNAQVAYFDQSGSGDHYTIRCRSRGASGSTQRAQIQFLNDVGSTVGSINSTGSATSYSTSSDYRLKENEVAISDGITRIKTLKPYKFNFKDAPDVIRDGFFAHEVSSVVPQAVSGEKDKVVIQAQVDNGTREASELGNPEYQTLDHSNLVPLLTAALQEEIKLRENLEARVATLEAS